MPTTCSCSAQPWSGIGLGYREPPARLGLPQAADLRRRGAVRAIRDRQYEPSSPLHAGGTDQRNGTSADSETFDHRRTGHARQPAPHPLHNGPACCCVPLHPAREAAYNAIAPNGIGAREAIGATVAPQPRQPQDSAPARPRPSASLAADTRRRLHIFLSRHRGCHVMISLTRGPRRARVRAATEEEVPSMTGHASAPEDRPPVS